MSKKSRLSCIAEYAALRVSCAVVNAVPYPIACAMARGIASCAVTFGFKRTRTLGRIAEVFPGIQRREAVAIAKESLANVLQSAVEMMRAPSLTSAWVTRHVREVDKYAGLLGEVLSEGKGAVIMVPHSGNWYMAAWAMASRGLPLSAVAARQRNPYVDAWMERSYGSIHVIERGSASTMRDVLGIIRSGRGFAILPDLRVPQEDVTVPFLNGTANVSHGGAMFAVATGAPIVVAVMRREGCQHVFDHLATLRPNPAAPDRRVEARRLTAEAMRLFDVALKRHPGQWFWYNKRWLLQPLHSRKSDPDS